MGAHRPSVPTAHRSDAGCGDVVEMAVASGGDRTARERYGTQWCAGQHDPAGGQPSVVAGEVTHEHRDALGRVAEQRGAGRGPGRDPVDDESTLDRREVDVAWRDRIVDDNGVEVIPAPGHSPGSTCFLVSGADGRYLFTGDTLLRGADGGWFAGCVPGHSDPARLAVALDLLADLVAPDLVVSSAFVGEHGAHRVAPEEWRGVVERARASLPVSTP